jgi:hypothetical protein
MAHGENTADHEGRKVHREKFEMPKPIGRTPKGAPGYGENYHEAVGVWNANYEAGHDPGPFPVRTRRP